MTHKKITNSLAVKCTAHALFRLNLYFIDFQHHVTNMFLLRFDTKCFSHVKITEITS